MDMSNKSNEHSGLSDTEVASARAIHGWNELPDARRTGPLTVFLRQFSSFLVLILIGAAAVAFFLGEIIDTIAIGLVVGLNAILGFVQEWRAETALARLREMMSPYALVIRNGVEQRIEARELLPGDLVLLGPGDRVPADADLLSATALQVDESVLTGESLPVDKDTGDRVFAGASVVEGRAEARTVAIGAETEFGQIASLTGSVDTKPTQLQRQLGRLATQVGIAAILVAAFILALGLLKGQDITTMFMTGLSLAVAMVPEGLPAVVTITLALGAAAMVRQKALARRLQAVETLGAASVICTDKTGTLTENKMTATTVWTLPRSYAVTGTGYDPMGHIERSGHRVRAADDPLLARLLQTGMTCTHARLNKIGQNWEMIGAPTEGALVTLGYKGWSPEVDRSTLLAEVPFSSDRKRMSVLARDGKDNTLFTKGAPEQVLACCSMIATDEGDEPLSAATLAEVEAAYKDMAGKGLRVLALAQRKAVADDLREHDLTFLGLVGMIDPPRPEVRAAIASAKSAGIRVIMVTGDSPITASAIADQLDLTVDRILTGTEIEDLDETELSYVLKQNVLFARTKPANKMRIISALQKADEITAMTGDGVNDAPALKQADIGVSMGIRGTDVARDASDLVLLDDNFATIVRAINEGRRQFSNVRKFVRYLLASNAGEVVALTVNILMGGPLIFLATQILWMNLVTDGVTAVALGLEKAEPDQMERKPRKKSEAILDRNGLVSILFLGLYTGAASLWIFISLQGNGVDQARTAAFTAMVVFEKVSVFAFRSLHLPNSRIGWFSNPLLWLALVSMLAAQIAAVYWPPLAALLHTVPIEAEHWLMIAGLALPIIIVPEFIKYARQLK